MKQRPDRREDSTNDPSPGSKAVVCVADYPYGLRQRVFCPTERQYYCVHWTRESAMKQNRGRIAADGRSLGLISGASEIDAVDGCEFKETGARPSNEGWGLARRDERKGR